MKEKMKSAIGLFIVLTLGNSLYAWTVSYGVTNYHPATYFANGQAIPSGDELKQLVAPFALFPDALVAQICAASTDPQQILDAHDWLQQNKHLHGQALTDAAQQHGFDPAFVSLVNFPTVLDMMAANINNYAALGDAFKANQQSVMSAIQTLRQDAYARGALDSNEYQTVSVQNDGNVQVVVVQPTNPQVVYVPQYQPYQVWYSGPSTGDVIAASVLSFGAGVALGSWLNNSQPWGWGGCGWGWGGRGMIVNNNVWVVNNRWSSPRPYFRAGPPRFNRSIYAARPPSNWAQRPGRRPPPVGWRPNGPNNRPGGNRPGGSNAANRPGGNRPGGSNAANRPGGNRPGGSNAANRPGGNRPGGSNAANRPGGNRPGGSDAANRPGGNRPGESNAANRPGGNRPGGSNAANRPGGNRPGGSNAANRPGGNRPGGNNAMNRPAGNRGGNRPSMSQSAGARPSRGGNTQIASNRGGGGAGGGRRGGRGR